MLSFTGTFTQNNPPPTGFEGGCWPDGNWTFTANIDSTDCAAGMAPTVLPSYTFTVTEDMDYNDTIVYTNDPTNMYVTAKISGGEGAVCTGKFLMFSADGKTIWNLQPAMQADNSYGKATSRSTTQTNDNDAHLRPPRHQHRRIRFRAVAARAAASRPRRSRDRR